ncbi:MAG TPA: sulfite exporter TauE/SafE family protein [Bryobacteraceae bacterium]|nr:sulfite exporter TauE/SafE family protein [Bryobacteraceae bacterium]
MIFLLGFLIALAIGVTGVGGGTITVPVLILFLHVAPAKTVGTALVFAAAVKLLVAPVYLYKKQVSPRTLGLMLAGGLPGVIAGLYFLKAADQKGTLTLWIGVLIIVTAIISIFRIAMRRKEDVQIERTHWLPWLMLPVGAEVGFSSAGAGAVGSLALLNLTRLSVAEVAGTNIVFGLVLSLIGGGVQMYAGNYDPIVLTQLVIGGLFGALIAPNLSVWMPSQPLRVALCVWLAALGTILFWHGYTTGW